MNIAEKLFENGASQRFVNAIKKGYEGTKWNKSIDEFLEDHYGKDIITKTRLVFDGEYHPWSKDLIATENNQNAIYSIK